MPAELFTLNVWLMTKLNTSVASGIVFASHKNQYNAILQSFYLLFLKELYSVTLRLHHEPRW